MTTPSSSSSMSMISIDSATLTCLLPPSHLIPYLLSSLPLSFHPSTHPLTSPTLSLVLNHHHHLIMPSWSLDSSLPYIVIKIVTSFPSLSPSIRTSFSLFSTLSSLPLAFIDGTHLTLLRTSPLSVAASSLLSPLSPSTLLLSSTSTLASHLITAYRSPHRSQLIASQL